MRAGDLKYRVVIKQPATTTDALGQEIEGTPTVVATVWAAKWQLTTKDINKQAGLSESAEAKFLIRHRDGITTDMQIEFAGKQYQIVGTEDYEDRVGLAIFVRSING